MNAFLHVFAALLLLIASACMGDTDGAPDAAAADVPCPDLAGSWELVSIDMEAPALTQEFELDPDYQEAPTLKVLNETHWMFIRQASDQFIHAQGGRYLLDREAGTYTEIVDYSAIPQNIGVRYDFDCRVEGDSIWYHKGGLGDTRYNEVWRKVE